jgi:hypothetical protein
MDPEKAMLVKLDPVNPFTVHTDQLIPFELNASVDPEANHLLKAGTYCTDVTDVTTVFCVGTQLIKSKLYCIDDREEAFVPTASHAFVSKVAVESCAIGIHS